MKKMGAVLLFALPWCAFAAFPATNDVPPAVLAFQPGLFLSPPATKLSDWIRGVSFDQGEVGGEPSSWHCAASMPEGAGRVAIEVNREVMNEDLALTLFYERNDSSDLAIQLCDAEGRVIALDLFKSVTAVAEQARTHTFIVPVRKFPSATRIVLRRISGGVQLYGVILAPVVTEQTSDLDELLALSKRLGDRLSPDSDFVRRIRELAAAQAAATNKPATQPQPSPSVLVPVEAPSLLPPPEPIKFAGFNWIPMRTDFELKDGALVSVPRPRAGKFEYRHSGHGRNAIVVTEVGSTKWRDYTMDIDLQAFGVSPSLNPHGLPTNFVGVTVMFRVADFKESWNEPGQSCGSFSIRNNSRENEYLWGVGGSRNVYSKAPRAWNNVQGGGGFEVASGHGLKLDAERGNHIRITIQGDHVSVWLDGALICDATDPRFSEEYEGVKLDHGGFGVQWYWETMGSIKNFKVQPIN